MTAREYLNQAYRIDLRIQSKQEQIASLNDLATRCTSTLTGMPRNPSPTTSPMADAICKIVDLQNEIATDMRTLIKLKSDIVKTIKSIKDVEYQILLEKRYLCEETWEQIAVDMNYGMTWLKGLHKRALDAVEIVLNESVTESDL